MSYLRGGGEKGGKKVIKGNLQFPKIEREKRRKKEKRIPIVGVPTVFDLVSTGDRTKFEISLFHFPISSAVEANYTRSSLTSSGKRDRFEFRDIYICFLGGSSFTVLNRSRRQVLHSEK